MSKVTVFETVHERAAGIDIGAARIFVSPDGIEVRSFNTFTSGYYESGEYLQEKGIEDSCDGSYLHLLDGPLRHAGKLVGLKVYLINPKETRQVKGEKDRCKRLPV